MENGKALAEHLLNVCIALGQEARNESLPKHDLQQLIFQVVDALTTLCESEPEGILREEYTQLLASARKSCATCIPLVHCFADIFVCHNSAPQYRLSTSRNRAINQLASIIIPPNSRISSTISNDVTRVARLVREQTSKLPYPNGFFVGKRWQSILDSMMVLVETWSDPQLIAIMAMNKGPFYMEVPPLTESRVHHISNYVKQFSNPLASVGESDLALPGSSAQCGSIKVSESLSHFYEMHDYLRRKEILPTQPSTIIEIGSGYGRFARGFHLARAAKCYVLVDLPESLLFAYAYISFACPGAKLLFIANASDVTPTLEEEYDFIFCPVQNFAHLKLHNVALALNIYSFGEMPQPCVDFLTRTLEENCRPRFLFTKNTFFTDRDSLMESCLDRTDRNGCFVTLNVGPHFDPVDFTVLFDPTTATDGEQMPRAQAFSLLRWNSSDPEAIKKDAPLKAIEYPVGSRQWLVHAFLAALWTENPYVVSYFLEGFKKWCAVSGYALLPRFDFEKISEVRFLRSRLQALEKKTFGKSLSVEIISRDSIARSENLHILERLAGAPALDSGVDH